MDATLTNHFNGRVNHMLKAVLGIILDRKLRLENMSIKQQLFYANLKSAK